MTDTTSKLCAEIEAYCNKHGLEWHSADEMAGDIAEQIFRWREFESKAKARLKVLESHHTYLTDFCERWEVAQTREDMATTLQRAGFALEVVGGGALMWSRYTESLCFMISGPEGEELADPDSECTLGVYDTEDGMETLAQIDCRNLDRAIHTVGKFTA